MKVPIAAIRFPERQINRFGRRRGHEDVVVGEALDGPVLGAKRKGLPFGVFPDKFFVELADAAIRLLMPEMEITPVRDRAPGEVELLNGALAGGDGAIETIEGNLRPQLAYPSVGVTSGEHVEDEVKLLATEIPVRIRGAQFSVEILLIARLHPDHGDDDLSEDIEGAFDRLNRLDILLLNPRRQHGRLDKIVWERREEDATADIANLVSGAAESLDGRGNGGRRLHEDDGVEGADVDAELQRICGDNRFEHTILQLALDLFAQFPRQ